MGIGVDYNGGFLFRNHFLFPIASIFNRFILELCSNGSAFIANISDNLVWGDFEQAYKDNDQPKKQ